MNIEITQSISSPSWLVISSQYNCSSLPVASSAVYNQLGLSTTGENHEDSKNKSRNN